MANGERGPEVTTVDRRRYERARRWLDLQEAATSTKALSAAVRAIAIWGGLSLTFLFLWGLLSGATFGSTACGGLSLCIEGRTMWVARAASLVLFLPLAIWIAVRSQWPTRPPQRIEDLLNIYSGEKLKKGDTYVGPGDPTEEE